MVRMVVIAVGAGVVSTMAIAQATPPQPSYSGAQAATPLLETMGEADRATDSTTVHRMHDELDKNREQQIASNVRPASGPARAAKAGDVQPGKQVNDLKGLTLALVEKVETDGVVLNTGASLVKIPLEAFGVNNNGLLLNVTKQQFDQLVASANPQKKP